jgi:hypothetical protein
MRREMKLLLIETSRLRDEVEQLRAAETKRATSLRPWIRLWRAEISGAEKQNAFAR